MGAEKLSRIDITDLPGLRAFKRQWRRVIFANTAARTEGKSLLFRELSVAIERGITLQDALETVARNNAEWKQWDETGRDAGAHLRSAPLKWMMAVFVILSGFLGGLILILSALRMSDPDRVARILAARLSQHTRRGHTLSEAMDRQNLDWTPTERRLLAVADGRGHLPLCLKRMAALYRDETRTNTLGLGLGYIIFIGILIIPIMVFVVLNVVPKIQDIFSQLGAELPWSAMLLLHFFHWFFATPVGLFVAIIVVPLVFLFVLARSMMNGNSESRDCGAAIVLLFVFCMAILFATVFLRLLGGGVGDDTFAGIVFLSAGLVGLGAVFVLPALMNLVESMVLRMERGLDRVLAGVPVLGRGPRLAAEANALMVLSVALADGTHEAEALRDASKVTGGRLGRRLDRAASEADRGRTLAQSCVMAGVFGFPAAAMVPLLDHRCDLPDALMEVSEDCIGALEETTAIANNLIENFVILALGLVCFLFALALYGPLFEISQVVGVDARGGY